MYHFRYLHPVHLAAYHDFPSAAVVLHAVGGFRLNGSNAAGFTPAHWAALRGNTDVLMMLHRGGVALDARPAGWAAGWAHTGRRFTPAHVAAVAASGSAETLNTLQSLGARVGLADADGDTPVHWAAAAWRADALPALHAAGASLAAKNKQGMTPAHCAANPEGSHFALSRGWF
eukprot:gene8245-5972_t